MSEDNKLPWEVINWFEKGNPYGPHVIIPESQARALFEGAKMILEIESVLFPIQQWKEGMANPHWVTYRKAIALLKEGIGE